MRARRYDAEVRMNPSGDRDVKRLLGELIEC